MIPLVPALLQLLGQAVPAIGAHASVIGPIVSGLVDIVPTVVQEFKDEIPVVKNIIAAVKANPATDPAQRQRLAELDALCDSEFEDAAKAADIEDGRTPQS